LCKQLKYDSFACEIPNSTTFNLVLTLLKIGILLRGLIDLKLFKIAVVSGILI